MIHLKAAILLIGLNSPVWAQHAHNSSHGPTEVGQAGFAALAEIVEILSADPKTDWSQVDITALRKHLVDMDRLTMEAKVTTSITEQEVTFKISGDYKTAETIKRMTAAHGPMLAGETGWVVEVEPILDGAVMTLTDVRAGDLNRIRALGFFGVMTIGAHHQSHHLMIATGADPH